jgi:hypothetical protein
MSQRRIIAFATPTQRHNLPCLETCWMVLLCVSCEFLFATAVEGQLCAIARPRHSLLAGEYVSCPCVKAHVTAVQCLHRMLCRQLAVESDPLRGGDQAQRDPMVVCAFQDSCALLREAIFFACALIINLLDGRQHCSHLHAAGVRGFYTEHGTLYGVNGDVLCLCFDTGEARPCRVVFTQHASGMGKIALTAENIFSHPLDATCRQGRRPDQTERWNRTTSFGASPSCAGELVSVRLVRTSLP